MGNQKIKILKFSDDEDQAEIKTIRAGVYARYSCIGNTPYSADEQVQRIRHRLESGMIRSRVYPSAKVIIDDRWVIKDEAQTGRVTRDGYELIKSGIRNKSFEMLLMDDISRTTRDMGDTIDLHEDLTYNDVEGFSVADNISTIDPNSRDLFIFKGYANEHQSKATSKNTIRGLEVRVLGGFSTGHNPYGYYSVSTKSALMKGVEKPSHFEIKIDYEKAQIILRIWSLFADQFGCREIARRLNDDLVPPPEKGRKSVGPKRWMEKSVWNILHQDKYVGIWRYRLTRTLKNPNSNKIVQKIRPKSEWLVSEREDLRIVPIDLEKKVRERQKQLELERQAATSTEQRIFSNRGKSPSHLFIGTMKCSVCGGNFILASGRSGGYLGCMNAHRQAGLKCDNRQMVRMSWVEHHFLDEIKRQMDAPATYEHIAKRYNEAMIRRHGDLPQRLKQLDDSVSTTEVEIANYDRFIRSGHISDVIASNLHKAESKLKTLKTERDFLRGQIQDKVFITPLVVRDRMTQLDEILGKKIAEANRVLKKLFYDKVTMTPHATENRKYYQASGVLNLYGLLGFTSVEIGVPQLQLSELQFIKFTRDITNPDCEQ